MPEEWIKGVRELTAAELGRSGKTRRRKWREIEGEFRRGRDRREPISLPRLRWLEGPAPAHEHLRGRWATAQPSKPKDDDDVE